jgi:hypothetical protein
MSTPDTGMSLLLIHSIITRSLAVAAEHGRSFAARGYPDAATRDGFVNYVTAFDQTLNAHHLVEDELVFPRFRELLPSAPFQRLTAEHRQMEPLLADLRGPLAGESAASLGELNRALDRIAAIWGPHIAIEESHFAPAILARLMTPEEDADLVRRVGEHSRQHTSPDYLIMPFLLHNLPPPERALFATEVPPIVTEQLVPVVWKDKWATMKPFLLP